GDCSTSTAQAATMKKPTKGHRTVKVATIRETKPPSTRPMPLVTPVSTNSGVRLNMMIKITMNRYTLRRLRTASSSGAVMIVLELGVIDDCKSILISCQIKEE